MWFKLADVRKPMIKKWLIAAILIAVVAIAAILLFVAYQPQGTSTLAPTVTHTSPLYGATGTAINTKLLVTFSKAMDPTTISTGTITLKHGTTSNSGTVTYTGVTATFTPPANLATSTVYTATVTTGVKDTSGNALVVNYVWSFTTGVLSDTTAPTVIGTSPTRAVPVDSTISATFSKAMNPTTISTTTFTIVQGSTSVSGTVTYAGTTASFKPSSNLALNTNYTATITTGAKDLVGNALKNKFVWTFTTSTSTQACAQTTVALNSAASFAVLGSSAVSNTGPTAVTGNVGVSPGSAIDGFPPGTVTQGTVHVGNDAASISAQADLGTAFNDAQGRTLCPIILDGNMGGLTLGPGLYRSGSSVEISSGDLTLDAQGNANAIFIFQIPSTLTTTSGRQVFLAGGAQAKNIFWVVGSSATLGTTSVLYGTIMAYASVTLTTGATLYGRALAQVGAVTLDSSTVTLP
jgi:hypothetical protein